MPDRLPMFLVSRSELDRLRADILAGATVDLDAYLAERVTVWSTVQDGEGRDVDVFVLHPSWIAHEPRTSGAVH